MRPPALAAIHGCGRTIERVLLSASTGGRHTLEAGGGLRGVMLTDVEPLHHHPKRSFLARPQIDGILAQVVGTSFKHLGVKMVAERTAQDGGVTGHHLLKKTIGAVRENGLASAVAGRLTPFPRRGFVTGGSRLWIRGMII